MKQVITIPSPGKKRIIASFLIIAAVFAASLYGYYSFESGKIHQAAARNMQAIAELKISQLSQWHRQQLAGARILFRFPLLAHALKTWKRHPEDTALRRMLQERMKVIKAEYGYRDVFLVSAAGDALLTSDDSHNKIDPAERAEIIKANNRTQAFEYDFFRSSFDQKTYYDVIAPIKDGLDQTTAILVLRTDPDDFLYPLIRKWPIPSQSSETVLLRKEGDSILYLNNLRFRDSTALRLKIPLTRTDLPAVQAALGKTGIFDGYDYRGVHTLAYLASVPNTPWFMVAKIDHSEIFEELTYRTMVLVIIAIILTALLAALAMLIYRSNETRLYTALLANEEKYKTLFMHAHDALFIVDDRGRIIDVNPSGCAMLGYTHNELIGRQMNDLFGGSYPAMDATQSENESPIEERLMTRKDGTHVPVEFSKTVMPDGKQQKIIRDITERKKIEKELKESRELLSETESAGRIGGWSINALTMEQTWTDETFRILEIDPRNGALKVPQGVSFIHPKDQTRAAEAVNRSLQAGEPFDQEWRITTAKGNDRWVHSIGHVYKEQDRVIRVGGSFQDITERKQAEIALRRQRKLLAQTEHLGRVGGFSIDATTMKQAWTDEIYMILEYDRDLSSPDLPETMKNVLLSPEEEVRELLRQAIEDGKPFDREWEIKTFKGNRRWVHVVAQPVEEGGRVTSITGFVQDVTERRAAEESLRKKEQEYLDLINSMEEGFCIIEMLYDEHGNPSDYRFLEINRMFEKHTGLKNIVGKTMREMVPDLENHWFEDLGKVARTGESLHFEAPANAMQRQFSVFAYRIGGEGSNLVGAVFTEITERKAMEEVVRDVQRREAIGVLSSGIAHDFNNLLAVMMGNIALVQTEAPPKGEMAKHLSQTMTAIESAADLTRQMLAYSGKGKFLVEQIDLVSEIRKNMSLLTVSVPKNVRLEMNLPSQKVIVTGDRGQLKQILMNLVINGGDAIGEMSGHVTVTLMVANMDKPELAVYEKIPGTDLKPGLYALLEVSDNGAGMSPEVLARIFDPFFTTKFIGRGLGLSAVLGIIRGHEGGIVIRSSKGVGSTFRIILPCCVEEPETQAQSESSQENPTEKQSASSDSSMTILVIDDEADVAEMACDLLGAAHHRAIAETNPLQAIEFFKEHKNEIGVVLLDWSMPEMNGKMVTHALHEIDPGLRIIITSGYSADEIKVKLGAETVAGFLQKPYSIEALHAVVERIVV